MLRDLFNRWLGSPSHAGQSAHPDDAKDDREAAMRARRRSRRVKAGVSIAIALAAGTFLACTRQIAPTPPKPTARPSPPPSEGSEQTQEQAPPGQQARDRSPAIDSEQHRRGMPVPDNLLE